MSSSAKKSKSALKRLGSRADNTRQLGMDLEASLKARYEDVFPRETEEPIPEQ